MKEIRKLYLFTFFRSFTCFASISIAYYRSNELSYFEIMLLQALYAIATAILEIPSGMLSDMIGRKKTLLIGTFSFVGAYTCGALGSSMFPFIIMQVLGAVGQSCYSGTFLALMYEDIEKDNSIQKSATQVFAILQTINLFSGLLASLLSVVIVKYFSMRSTYVITVLMYLLTLVVNFTLQERCEGAGVYQGQYSVKRYFSIFWVSIKRISNTGLITVFVDMIIFACFANTLLYMEQPILLDRHFPVEYFGGVTVVITVATTIVLKFIGKIEEHIQNLQKFLKRITVFIILMIISNLLIRTYIWGILTFLLLTIVIRIREIFILTEINRVISNDVRATVMSIVSAIQMVGISVLSIGIGYCEDISINFAISVLALIITGAYVVLWKVLKN